MSSIRLHIAPKICTTTHVWRYASPERIRTVSNMRVQRQLAQEVPVDGREQQTTGSVTRKPVVYDADPHAHLTPAERYELALQRRDRLLAAQSEPSR